MSIIRIGLAENKKFAAGYDAIFAKTRKTASKQPDAAKKSAAKRKAKKK